MKEAIGIMYDDGTWEAYDQEPVDPPEDTVIPENTGQFQNISFKEVMLIDALEHRHQQRDMNCTHQKILMKAPVVIAPQEGSGYGLKVIPKTAQRGKLRIDGGDWAEFSYPIVASVAFENPTVGHNYLIEFKMDENTENNAKLTLRYYNG